MCVMMAQGGAWGKPVGSKVPEKQVLISPTYLYLITPSYLYLSTSRTMGLINGS